MSMQVGADSHAFALGLAVAMTSVSQILLRSGAKGKDSLWISFWNLRTLIGCGSLLIVTVLTVYAMRRYDLKTVTAWAASSYILTPLLGHWILNEKMNAMMAGGAALVVFGILVFTLGDFYV